MKKSLFAFVFLAALFASAVPAHAQWTDITNGPPTRCRPRALILDQANGIPYVCGAFLSEPIPIMSVRTGPSNPATCSPVTVNVQASQLFINTSVNPAQLVYCSATNTWSPVGGGGGGSSVLLQTNGFTNPTQTFLNLTFGGQGFSITNPSQGNVLFTLNANQVFSALTLHVATDLGSANAYSNCPSTPTPTIQSGLIAMFFAQAANTAASTFNYCGTGALPIVKAGGTALAANDIQVNQLVFVVNNASNSWQLLNPSSAGTGSAVTFQQNGIPTGNQTLINFQDVPQQGTHWQNPGGGSTWQVVVQGNIQPLSVADGLASDSGAVNAYAACPGSPNPNLSSGLQIHFTAGSTNTASSTFNLCGTGALPVVKGGGSNIVAGDIVNQQLVSLDFNAGANNWQLLNPSVIGGSGSVSGQAKGQGTIGTSATSISTTPAAQFTSVQTGSDLCTRIRAAQTACTTSTCHIVIDEGGKQFCNVQPFLTAAGNPYSGSVEYQGNGTALNLWLDGISTLQYGSAFTFNGHGATGSSNGTNGGTANMNFVICNPALMTCPSGGFAEEQGTVTSTSYAANVLTINVSGTPFTTCTSTGVCTNGGSSQPTNCDTGHANAGGGCVNMVAQWRLLCIAGSATANNNGCRIYKTTSAVTTNQSFQVYAENALTNCAASCGTVYLDTPVIIDSCDGGCSGGTYENLITDFTIQGMFMPGSGGFVHAAGEEITMATRIQIFNTMAYSWRFDQSSAYAGAPNGDTNSGPFGPFSGNLHNAQCMKAGGCACSGTNGACSAGSAPNGSSMFCGGAATNTGFASISPDPCVNGNFVGALFTGATGSQGPDVVFHQTESISNLNGTSNSSIAGTGDHQASAVGVFGTQAELSHNHGEYFPTNFAICGDKARNNMWYQAYGAIQTGSVIIRGGLNGSNTSLYFDIGDASTAYGNNNLCAGIHIDEVFGGTTGSLTDNVTGHDMNLSTDEPTYLEIGTGNNPPVRTSQGNGGWGMPWPVESGACNGAIGQATATTYFLPPYTKTNTSSGCQVTTGLGLPAPHACIAQNLNVKLGTAATTADITVTLSDVTTAASTLTCTVAHGGTTCQDLSSGLSRNATHNIKFSQGDLMTISYTVSANTDATGADIHVTAECF